MTCLTASADQRKFYLFAYNTHMLCANKNLKSLETMVSFEVSNVYDRLTAKKTAKNLTLLSFDVDKKS